MTIRYTPAVQSAGETVVSHAGEIQNAGDDMYRHLNNLVSGGQLTGPGIAAALAESQERWNRACSAFAEEEQRFGVSTQQAYENTMAADTYGGNLISG